MLRVVCGEDHARGDLAKDFYSDWGQREDPINVDNVEIQEENKSRETQSSKGKGTTSQTTHSSGRKRGRDRSDNTEALNKLVEHVSVMATALTTGFKGPSIEKLGANLFSLPGFDKSVLKAAYNYLYANADEATKFNGLPEMFRIEWLENFQSEMFSRPPQ